MRLPASSTFVGRWWPSGLAIVLLALAALVAALVMVSAPGTAQAQTSDPKLIGTTENPRASGRTFNSDIAQAFTTGRADSTLTRVDLMLRHHFGPQPTYSVSIHSDSSGRPGSLLATLTNPSSIPISSTPSLFQFTAPGSGVALTADTTYWVVLDVSAGTPNTSWRHSGGVVDPGAASGWSISNLGRSRSKSSTGAWAVSNPFVLAIHGQEVPVGSAIVADEYLYVTFDRDVTGCPSGLAWVVRHSDGENLRSAYADQCTARSMRVWLTRARQGLALAGQFDYVSLAYDKSYALYYGGTKLAVNGVEVNSFSGVAVTNRWPLLAGAAVNGNVLTLTYDQALDGSSVPAGDGFSIHARHGGGEGIPPCRNCRLRVTDVSVSGRTVTLILEHPVPHGAGVDVKYGTFEYRPNHPDGAFQYTVPSSNPIRNPAGHDARAFGHNAWNIIAVAVRTPDAPPVLTSAGIKLRKYSYEDIDGVRRFTPLDDPETWLWMEFSEKLDESFTPDASAFTVRAGRTIAATGDLAFDSWGKAGVRLSQDIPDGQAVTVSYAKPSANGLRDLTGNLLESFSGKPVNNGQPPTVTSVSVSSDPGDDDIYERGEKVRVQVTFSERVVVSGGPRLRLFLGQSASGLGVGAGKWAHYEGGSGTQTLTFAYTVGEGDYSGARGIIVSANSLERNGGNIASYWNYPSHGADLSRHPGTSFDRNHQVDGRADETVWTATLDPKKFGNPNKNSGNHYFIGCDYSGGSAACWQEGRLEPETAFTHAGTRYSFYEVFNHQSWNGAWELKMNLDREVPGDWTLHVGDRAFCVESGDRSSDGRAVAWNSSGDLNWVEGTGVSLKLTAPPAGAPWSCGGSGGHALPTAAAPSAPPLETLWSATLTVGALYTATRGCQNGFTTECTSALDEDSFRAGGTSYQVSQVSRGVTFVGLVSTPILVLGLDKEIPRDWTLHVGDRRLPVADATLSNSDQTATWNNPGFTWTNGQKVQLRLTTGGGGAGGNSGGTEPASVTGVSVVSDAGADRTYGDGDTIRVRVTFDGPVDVTGTPRLKIKMDPDYGEKWAAYDGGGGTSSLTFVHTVVEPNLSTQGIAVLADTLVLNGGAITAGGADADLSHDGLAHDANHKVDWQVESDTESGPGGTTGPGEPPQVTAVAITSDPGDDDTYGDGDAITVSVTFDAAVDVTGAPQLTIKMDPDYGEKQAAFAGGSGTATLTFTHTVAEPNVSTQGIAVLADTLALNGGAITAGGADADLAHDGLAHDANHKVDWQVESDTESGPGGTTGPGEPPQVTAVAITSDPGDDDTYGDGDAITVSVTFDAAVDVTGAPQLTIKMDPDYGEKQAAFAGGSGTATLTFTHTVAEPNVSTQGIAVLADTLELNGGTIVSAAGSAAADLSHTGLAHDAGHKVDWQQSPSPANNPATGAPTVTGAAQVGETLTADTSGISDADGLTGAAFGYQWLADDADLAGATGSAYTLADADIGKAVKVRVSFTDDAGHGETLTSAATAPVAARPPEVTAVSITSDPGDDDTYGDGDAITISVTFDQAVNVTGAPRLRIKMDPDYGGKRVFYSDGSGTATLIFTHTVVEPNISTQGIAVLAGSLRLNGGTIQSAATGADADLSQDGLAHDAGHKVDWQQSPPANNPATGAPTVTGAAQVGETLTADTSGISDTDGLTGAVFAYQWLADDADISGATGSAYTLAGADVGKAAKVRVSFTDDAGHEETLTSAATAAVAARPPEVTAVSITSDPGDDDTYGDGDTITISVTFDQAVDVTGAPRIAIDMDPADWGKKLAAYHSGSGTTTLTFTHKVAEPNLSTQGIAVLADTLALNGGSIQSASGSVAADLSHAGLAHDSGHKVDWQQSDDGGAGS
ncbi:MAG: SwmB domain-containing protein [Chloroflexota bacterium]|nr:SwmB domain-containing protein [Chloroflexota bacterium]